MIVELTLSAEQIHQIALVAADLAVENLRTAGTAPELVDAATLARSLGVSRDTVYTHADELGGRRVGDGARPRLRFNLAEALAAWQPAEQPTRTAPRRRRSVNDDSNLLPVAGQ